MVKIDLIQPRHNYAPSSSHEQLGHVYMPTSLLTVSSRLLSSGVDIAIHDENIRPRQLSSRHVGINLLGSPYVPVVMNLQNELRKEIGEESDYLLGGKVISGFSPDQFKKLFGESSHDGNDDNGLAGILGIDPRGLKSKESTSLIPSYELLDDEMMKEYLSREFSLYVSQGCKFACDFCGAERTFIDPASSQLIKIKETYRSPEIIKKDLQYLVERAKGFGIDKLSIYMSNLDVFQTPNELLQFAYVVQDVKKNNPGFKIDLRGLATVDSYLRARDSNKKSIEQLVEAGFNTVGFGIDGVTPQVWNAVKKGHNSEDKCLESIRSAKDDFGITPEILMVFGHVGVDTEETLKLAYDFTMNMVDNFGAVPRPHVAKAFVPGNDGWRSKKHAAAVETLLNHPESFQSLDFTALPSSLTHPDKKMRKLATEYFLKICSIPGNTTLHVKPITPDLTDKELEEVKNFNKGKYDR